jgi:hypothetical protein
MGCGPHPHPAAGGHRGCLQVERSSHTGPASSPAAAAPGSQRAGHLRHAAFFSQGPYPVYTKEWGVQRIELHLVVIPLCDY